MEENNDFFSQNSFESVINELKIHCKVGSRNNHHPNICQIFGIAKEFVENITIQNSHLNDNVDDNNNMNMNNSNNHRNIYANGDVMNVEDNNRFQTQSVWTTLNMNHRKEFSDLPNECVLKIFSYLNDVKDLYNCLFINKFIHGIAVYMLWKNPFINNAKWRDSIILTYLNELNLEEQKTLIPLRINFPFIKSHSSKYAPCLETLDLHFLHIACLKWLAGAGYFCQCGELRIVQAVVSAIVRMVLRTNRNLKILSMKVAEDEPDVSNASIFSSSQPGISSLHSFHLTLNNTPTKKNVSQFLTKLPDLCLSLCDVTFDFAETDIDEKITTLLIKLIRVQKALNHFTLKCRGAITGKYIETLESQKDHLISLHLDRLDFRKISDDSLK
ncbi:1757_t:CDS:2, partial [Cetraspora pellucida]